MIPTETALLASDPKATEGARRRAFAAPASASRLVITRDAIRPGGLKSEGLRESDTRRWPSGVTATPLTYEEWPSMVRRAWPVLRSHRISVPSFDADNARRPSGVTATPIPLSEWPSG